MDDLEADRLWLAGGCSLPKCSNCGGYLPDNHPVPTHPPHPIAAGKLTCDEVEIEDDYGRLR